ncbi:MAG: hypothetical protein HUU29_08000 [Planctomycetaceae bacterium]|nr:hypothetical protein [Planctomycetaceae bacterium]
MRQFTIAIVTFLFVGCQSTGGGPGGFVGERIDDAAVIESSSADSDKINGMIDALGGAEAEGERSRLVHDLIAAGKSALPYLRRAGAQTRDARLSLDLLYIESQIESAGSAGEDSEIDPPTQAAAMQPTKEAIDSAYGIEGHFDDDGSYDTSAVDQFVKVRFGQAYRAFHNGDRDTAIRLCEAILVLAPQSRYRRQVQQLLYDARTSEQQERVLAGRMSFDRDVVQYSDDGKLTVPLGLRITLKNMSGNNVDLDFGDGSKERGTSLLSLSIQLTEEDARGSRRSYEVKTSVELTGEKISLVPGQSAQVSRTLQDLGSLPQADAGDITWRTVLSVSGNLRLPLLKNGDERSTQPVLLSGAQLTVFPKDFPLDEARKDPVAFLTTRLSENDPVNIVLCAALIKASEQRVVLDLLLADDLAQAGNAMRRARLAAASRLSGENHGNDAEAWQKWWKDNRFRYES